MSIFILYWTTYWLIKRFQNWRNLEIIAVSSENCGNRLWNCANISWHRFFLASLSNQTCHFYHGQSHFRSLALFYHIQDKNREISGGKNLSRFVSVIVNGRREKGQQIFPDSRWMSIRAILPRNTSSGIRIETRLPKLANSSLFDSGCFFLKISEPKR
jgi:hypothetical protein